MVTTFLSALPDLSESLKTDISKTPGSLLPSLFQKRRRSSISPVEIGLIEVLFQLQRSIDTGIHLAR